MFFSIEHTALAHTRDIIIFSRYEILSLWLWLLLFFFFTKYKYDFSALSDHNDHWYIFSHTIYNIIFLFTHRIDFLPIGFAPHVRRYV